MAGQAKGDGREHAAHHAAILLKVAQTMAKAGVAAFPRNYELFYEALSGRNRPLTRDLAGLGAQPSQSQLEEIGTKYHLPGFAATAAQIAQTIGKASEALSESAAKRKALSSVLNDVAALLRAEGAGEAARLRATLAAAERDETAALRTLTDTIKQLGALKSEPTQAVAMQDPATGPPNRLAFSAKLAAVYEEGKPPAPVALSLVTVDGLRDIGERYGMAAAEKVLKKLAPLFRKSVKKGDFVARIGGDEFAFVLHDVSIENAEAVARRIRTSVEELVLTLPNRTASANMLSLFTGMAMSATASGTTDLFVQAELALRAVRSGGKPGILFSSAAGSNRTKQTGKSNAA